MDGLCFDDLDEFARELDDPFAELEQDVIHILLEVFGSNPDVPLRGAGLRSALSGPANLIPSYKAQIESQLEEDARITKATVDIQKTDTRGRYRVDITLEVNQQLVPLGFLVDSAGGVRRAP